MSSQKPGTTVPSCQHDELLREAQSLAGLGCFDWDIQTGRLEWTDELFRIYGHRRGEQELSLEFYLNLLVPEEREIVQETIQYAIETCGEFQHSNRVLRPDGEIRIIESRGRVIANEQGVPERLIGACQDVTKTMQTEIALNRQVAGLQLLSDLTTDVMARDASRFGLSDVLNRIAEHLDCSVYYHVEFSGDACLKVNAGNLPPKLEQCFLQTLLNSDARARIVSSSEITHVTYACLHSEEMNAQALTVQHGIRSCMLVPIHDGHHCEGAIVFASRTIDSFSNVDVEFAKTVGATMIACKKKRDIDREARRTEERHDMVLGHARTAVWECNSTASGFRFVSDYCEELLGFPVDAWYEPDFLRSRIHPDDVDTTSAYITANTEMLRDHNCEFRMMRQDGSTVWVEAFVNVVATDGQATTLRGAFVDVTHRKRLEQELRQSQKMEAIGRLAGGIAHDFNNVLTVISTYAELMQSQLQSSSYIGQQNADHASYIQAIQEASERAAALTSQLLLFSRKSINEPKTLDLNDIVRQSQKLLRRVIGEDIELRTHVDDRVDKIKSDRSHLEQIILNLAINARDAMPDGGQLTLRTEPTTILPKSESSELPSGDYVKLTVADDGRGMSAETCTRCFEPFYTTKEVGKGTGLGLSVTYGVVSESGGTISVESELGRGTTFTILFPAAGEMHVSKAIAPERFSGVSRGTVLLVEDEEGVRRVARMSLETSGFDVIEASAGREAIDLLNQTEASIDILVTDLIMPGMSGESLATELRSRFPELRVLFISGYGQGKIASRMPSEIFFLQKPFTAHQLTDAVMSTLFASSPMMETSGSTHKK